MIVDELLISAREDFVAEADFCMPIRGSMSDSAILYELRAVTANAPRLIERLTFHV